VAPSLMELARRWRPRQSENAEIEQLRIRLERTTRQLKYAREVAASLSARVAARGLSEPVTGLPNRNTCLEIIEQALKPLRENPGPRLAVFSVGFDGLQRVADMFGYPVLDRLLLEAARRIETLFGPVDTVFRTGETRLAVIVADVRDESRAEALAVALRDVLRQECQIDGGYFHPDPQIGIACVAGGHESADQILGRAVLAMYRAAEPGYPGVASFRERSAEDVALRLMLEAGLRRALALDEFVLWYQPVFDTFTNTLSGFEALLRWEHLVDGIREPSEFLPVAQEMGLMSEITHRVLRKAAAQAATWARGAHERLFISVNLTAESFAQAHLLTEIESLLAEYELRPGALRLEISEDAVAANVTRAGKRVSALKELGIPVWLDDFGAGHSCLRYLRDLELQGVKLDAAFVAPMVADVRDFGMVKSIIDLLRNLEMACVAEGVETQEQRRLLALAGCEFCQGYVFGHPMPAAEAQRLLGAKD
jgi:diguanylate cyclase (GGDEF)-like protein